LLVLQEGIMQENTREILKSKQRVIDYQITEEKRVQLMNFWEQKIENALVTINPSMTTPEALLVFCGVVEIPNCEITFDIDVYQSKATIKKSLTFSKENYSITFPRGAYFYAKL